MFLFFQVHRSPNHQPGGQVQAVPRPRGRHRPQERPLPLHQRRTHHQIRRSRHQGKVTLVIVDVCYIGVRQCYNGYCYVQNVLEQGF
jgi:hypothetical protein